jgi:hypothetical protein
MSFKKSRRWISEKIRSKIVYWTFNKEFTRAAFLELAVLAKFKLWSSESESGAPSSWTDSIFAAFIETHSVTKKKLAAYNMPIMPYIETHSVIK